jgi:hypothetical protein
MEAIPSGCDAQDSSLGSGKSSARFSTSAMVAIGASLRAVPLGEVAGYPLAFLSISINHRLFEHLEVCVEDHPA